MKPGKRFKFSLTSLTHVVFALAALVLAGCVVNSPAAVETEPATPVTVQLAWLHTIEYSGFYVAEDKGYYTDENVAVTLNELGAETPIDQLVNGQADFGVTSADNLLLARSEGAPVVAIAAIYQRSPVAFISLAQKNIIRPQDLIDKTVVVDFKGTTGLVYRAMLATQGIDPAEINSVQRTDYSNEPLTSGQADVMDAFINNQPVQLEQEGYDLNMILPADYGIDVYANVIFASEDTVANKPELVERFLRATVRGMQGAVEDAEGAAALAVARSDQLNLASETTSMQRALPLFNPAGSKPGLMRVEAWEAAHQILLDQGLLDKVGDLEAAYTLAFLEKIYGQE